MNVAMNPQTVALELLERNKGYSDGYARYRAAEVEAWKLRDAHGRESAEARVLVQAAITIAEMYHARNRAPSADDFGRYNVPVFNPQPQ